MDVGQKVFIGFVKTREDAVIEINEGDCMVREAISENGKQLPRSRKETCSIHLIHRCTPCGNKIRNPNPPTSWQAPELTQARFDQHDGRIVSSTKLVTESSINSSGRPT